MQKTPVKLTQIRRNKTYVVKYSENNSSYQKFWLKKQREKREAVKERNSNTVHSICPFFCFIQQSL